MVSKDAYMGVSEKHFFLGGGGSFSSASSLKQALSKKIRPCMRINASFGPFGVAGVP